MPHPIIHQSIEDLYAACSVFPKPSRIDSCDCCHTDQEKGDLLSIPLKSLDCEHLNGFIFSAFNTIGDAESFLYFMPRILELAFTNYQEFDADKGLLGKKLYQSGYWERGEKVRVGVDAALLAHFEHQVLQDTDWNHELCDWVCCIGNAVSDIDPFLKLLIDSPYFKEFYESEHGHAIKGKLSDAFWEDHHGNQQKIVRWLMSDESELMYWSFFK